MFLLLVQMFPQFLALVAIYLIMDQIGDVFPPIGLDTLAGLGLVYLGGAMGINAWLIKGFFDTIPMEIDESAKVDGATPRPDLLGHHPAAGRTRARGRGPAELHLHPQRVHHRQRAASRAPRTTTLAVGLQQFIANEYSENWGPFAAGALLAAIPVVILFLFLQKFIVGGLTAGSVKG